MRFGLRRRQVSRVARLVPRQLAVESLEGRHLLSGSGGRLRETVVAPVAAVAVEAAWTGARPLAVRRADRPGRSSLRERNLVYTAPGAPEQRLDVYVPRGEAPEGGWPVVLAIHGGGWRRYSKEQYAARVANPLLRAGFAVVAPNYSLSAPGRPSWPVSLDQLRQAVRWVHAQADRLQLNDQQIAALGESAGGHLAALLGTDPGEPDTRVQAVIDFYGPVDLVSLPDQSPEAKFAINQFFGGAAFDLAQRRAASPLNHVSPDDPPVLIVQGTADTVVPQAQSDAFAEALRQAGVPYRYLLMPNAPHGFALNVNGRSLMPSIVEFLRDSFARPN